MKDFILLDDYNLHHDAASWLVNMGLRETRWMLDAIWISFSYDMTYKKWINE